MQVTRTNADGLRHNFKVVIPAGQLATEMETRLVEVGRTVRIPGFRPGKVPIGILRKKYGPSVMGEVVETAVNDGARQAIADHDLRPALRPEIEITSYAEGGDLEFTVAVETLPDVQVMDLATLALERRVAEVSDDALGEALERIAANREKTVPAAEGHVATAGDVVVIDFVGKKDGQPFDGGKAEGYSLKLGSGSFIPGFEDQLIGAKAGDERVIAVTFPADYGSADLAGKEATFDVKVKEIRRVAAAAVDDELAKGLGFDSLEAFRKSLKEEIARDYAGVSRAHLKRRLLDVLAAGHSFAVPQGMVKLEFDAIWQQVQKDREAGRGDPSDAGKSDDELKAEYRDIAVRRVRLGLLLAEIGRQNNISVTQEDLNRAVMAEARSYPGQEHVVLQYYQRNPEARENLRAPVFEEKVVDFIIELAKVTDRKVTVEQLRADPEGDVSPQAEGKAAAPADAKPKKKTTRKKTAAKEDAAAAD